MIRLSKRVKNMLRNRGERPEIEKKFEKIFPVLQFAYKLAAKNAKGKSILDFGCGGGYGAEYLSRFTTLRVVGYDVDKGTISANTHFFQDCKNLKFTHEEKDLGRYDLVTAFQFIEHLTEKERKFFLEDVKNKYLKNGGLFLVSTPNKNITSYKLKKPIMPFHMREFESKELQAYLLEYFQEVKCYGQIKIDIEEKARRGEYSFSKEYNKGFSLKFLRFISQINFVRIIARMLPVAFKNFVRQTNIEILRHEKYILTEEQNLIDNSFILIFECK